MKLIAEIGCNHMGEMSKAKELIDAAASFCNADVIKFQKRDPRTLLTPEQYSAPHPVPGNSFGDTYGEHREFLELSIDQHRELQDYCASKGAEYSSSVWDLPSAEIITTLNPSLIKIPSPCNTHFEMLDYLCSNYGGEIHLSVGMTTREETDKILEFFQQKQRNKDLVLYSCTSGYPIPFDDICLLEISRLKSLYGSQVKAIGFSGHHLGIAVDIAAMTLGAQWIERHFTMDRTWKGTDHAASLEPDGLRKLKRDLENVARALRYKESDLLDIEKPQREKLKWRPHEAAQTA